MATKAKLIKKKKASKASRPGVKKSKATNAAPMTASPREGSKQEMVVAMMREKAGATLGEIMEATGWQTYGSRVS